MMPMDSPLATTFYAIDSDGPTIRTYPRSRCHAWSALSAALANHYGVDAESIHAAEAYWNGDSEFAEVVKLDGRIVGAVDRGDPAQLVVERIELAATLRVEQTGDDLFRIARQVRRWWWPIEMGNDAGFPYDWHVRSGQR